MDFDLGSRGKKLQKEQAARREAARLKMEREKALVEKTNQLRVEMEVEAQRRRDELAQQAAARRVEEQRITGGIVYKKSLRAVPIANDGDKVTLPVSALEELNPQNALDLGVFTFELVAGGHTTHASVLEFVADEHTIGIPPKVARSLHLMDEAVDIAVRFVRLEKGCATHTTLTEGDILLVRHGKVTFEVAVKEIVPQPQQSLQRQADALARLPTEPPLDDDTGVIKLMVRTPDGSQHPRRFAASDSVATLYDFVTSITGLASFLMATNYPRRVIPLSTLPLQDAGFRGRQEAVFVEPCKAPTAVPDQAVNDVDMQVDDAARALFTPDVMPVHALEPVLPTQVDGNKWGAQLHELESMGFVDRDLNVQILEKYQGRLLRVVNYLSELAVET
ncbi:hypothetical protein DYB37_009316 [Aphanomyces astaci]|uniref:UBX domain-containing protein n=1 Tax=Aphanomyces astaci TaxID=112090 RepID=A0A3R7B087_APHAT|nr:hypothetical protein DYB35_008556 [Aphanomyces astaci]RHZ14322.1 hypothetical protein DYB37_009316 [Aphanomyces astaci]